MILKSLIIAGLSYAQDMVQDVRNVYVPPGEGGSIIHPESGMQYGSNDDIIWNISAYEPHHLLQGHFESFDIEFEENCGYDYVEIINAVSGESWGTACGTYGDSYRGDFVGPDKYFNFTSIQLHFRSDGGVENSGFKFVFQHLPLYPIPGNDTIYINAGPEPSELRFPEVGPYGPSQNITWQIDSDVEMVGFFVNFDVEAEPMCLYDYVNIVADGMDFGRSCGSMEENNVIGAATGEINFKTLRLNFVSDHVEQRIGFIFYYYPKGSVSPPETTTTTPGSTPHNDDAELIWVYPDMNETKYFPPLPWENTYEANEDKEFHIITDSTLNVTLSIVALDIEFGAYCEYDFIEITIDNGEPMKYCGGQPEDYPPKMQILNFAKIRFVSDEVYHWKGFAFNVQAVPNYEVTDCMFGFYKDPVTLTCNPCPVGSFRNNLVESYCLPCPVGTYSDTFGSVSCLPCPDGYSSNIEGATSVGDCYYVDNSDVNIFVGSMSDHIQFFSYPGNGGNYTNNALKVFRLTVEEGHSAYVSFMDFDIEFSPTCEFDKVILTLDGEVQEPLCGNYSTNDFSQGRMVYKSAELTFSSDGSVTGNGFSFFVEKAPPAEVNNCPQCSHGCIKTHEIVFECACPYGMTLSNDLANCEQNPTPVAERNFISNDGKIKPLGSEMCLQVEKLKKKEIVNAGPCDSEFSNWIGYPSMEIADWNLGDLSSENDWQWTIKNTGDNNLCLQTKKSKLQIHKCNGDESQKFVYKNGKIRQGGGCILMNDNGKVKFESECPNDLF